MDDKQFWLKVREHAWEGQHGSAEYAQDRLKQIHELAVMALSKIMDKAQRGG